MDTQRFDSITKVLSSGGSRRRVLRGLLSGTGAGMLGRLAAHEPTLADPPACEEGERRCQQQCYTPPNEKCCHCGRGCTAVANVSLGEVCKGGSTSRCAVLCHFPL